MDRDLDAVGHRTASPAERRSMRAFQGNGTSSKRVSITNWHRHYDPTLGRYAQPDPLGFVDGPSVYTCAKNAALMNTDRDGRVSIIRVPRPPKLVNQCTADDEYEKCVSSCYQFTISIACIPTCAGSAGLFCSAVPSPQLKLAENTEWKS